MALLLLYLLAVAVPTAHAAPLNGLPFDSVLELLAVLIPVPLLVSGELRRRWLGVLDRRAALRRAAIALAACALALKVVGLAGGGSGAFEACFRSPVAVPAPQRCEASFADPLRLAGATRFDTRLDVPAASSLSRSAWSFDWANRLAYNAADPRAGYPRDRMPFEVTWRGALARSAPRDVLIRYVGEGDVDLGGGRRALPPIYDRVGEVRLPRPPGAGPVRIHFRFGAQGGAAAGAGPYAAFRLLDAASGRPLQAAHPAWAGGAVPLAAVVALLLSMLWAYATALGAAGLARVAAATAGGTIAAVILGAPGLVLARGAPAVGLCVILLLCAQALRPRRHLLLSAFLALCALVPATALLAGFEPSSVLYQPFGEDWFAYQGHAHDILRTRSLEGGEPVFYYQPAMRYVIFGGHALLGAGDLLPVSLALGLAALSVAFCVARLVPRFAEPAAGAGSVRGRGASPAQPVGALLVAGLVIVLVGAGVELFVRYGASETPTWVIFPAAVALLFSTTSARAWAAGAALVGLWIALRLNDAPAALALLALFCLQRGERRRRVQIATAGVGVFLAAILLHNAVYGGELALVRAEPIVGGVTAHGTDSGVGALGAFVKAFSDPAVRAAMADRARAILYLPFALPTDLETLVRRVAFHGLQLTWLAAVAWAVVARRSTSLAAKGMVLLPVVALAPYLALNVTAYYPRQIVVGYVAMGVSALYVLGSAGGARERTAPSSSPTGPPCAARREDPGRTPEEARVT